MDQENIIPNTLALDEMQAGESYEGRVSALLQGFANMSPNCVVIRCNHLRNSPIRESKRTQTDFAADTNAQTDCAADTNAQTDFAADTNAQMHFAADIKIQTDFTADTNTQTDFPTYMNTPTNFAADRDTQTNFEIYSTSRLQNNSGEEEEEHKEEQEEVVEEEDSSTSRDEIFEINLRNHLNYISHCIKPDDLIRYLHCYSDEQKSDILSEKSPIRASRKALDMLLYNVQDLGRFAELRDALDRNGGYPKIVRILDGDYVPEDKNFVRIVELFAPELIGFIKPPELLPHLLSKGVFTQMDVEEITAEEKNHGQLRAACILLMYLPRRAVDWYRSFLDVLVDCKLEDTANMLDPDLYEVIMKERKKSQHRGINLIKHAPEKKKPKPKIAPKPKAFSRDNKDVAKKPYATCSDSEDEIEYTEFNEEELEYVLNNKNEREKLEEKMVYIDAKILWPERKKGYRQRILLRSLSKEEYTNACIWSRKKRMWKQNALKIFQELFGQVKVSDRSNESKIISRKVSPTVQSDFTCHRRVFKKNPIVTQHSSTANENNKQLAKSSKVNFQKKEKEKGAESEPGIAFSGNIEKIAECLMASGRRIFILNGSIVDIEAEALVNATNKSLSFSTGISETIREKGGEKLQAACRRFLQTQHSIDEGETFVSEGGELQAKYVIHVNSPVYDKGEDEEITLLKQTVGRVLAQASRKRARTIAMPAIGCGNSGWHAKTAAPLIVGAVRNFFREEQESSLRHVYVVDLNSNTTKRFHIALCDTFKDDHKCMIQSPP